MIKGKNQLIVYVRNPEPGKVKSRLIPALGETLACDIYLSLLKNLNKELLDIEVPIRISYPDDPPSGEVFSPQYTHSYSKQIGGTLGDRMYNDLSKALAEGFEKVCLIGSDIPDLNADIITSAFNAIQNNQVALGPTFDGGYYLIGCGKSSGLEKSWFSTIEWSSSSVWQDTVIAIENSGTKVKGLGKLRDIDIPEDLRHFPKFKEIISLQD